MDQLQKREGYSSHWDNTFPSENNSQSQSASGRIAEHNMDIQSRYLDSSEMNLLARFGLSSEDLEELSHLPDNQLTPENMPSLLKALRKRKMAHGAPTPPSKSAGKETLCSAGGHGPAVKKKVVDYGHKSKYEGLLEGSACNSSVAMDDNMERFQTQQAAFVPAASSNLISYPKNTTEEPVRQVGSQDWIRHQNTGLPIENCHRPHLQCEADREERYTSMQRSASRSLKLSRCSSPGHARHQTRPRSRSSERHAEGRPRSRSPGRRSRSPEQPLNTSRSSWSFSSTERRSGHSSRSPDGQWTRTPHSEKRHDEWKETHSSCDCWEKRNEAVEETRGGGSCQKPPADKTGRKEQKPEKVIPEGQVRDGSEHMALASLAEKSVLRAMVQLQAQGGRDSAAGAMDMTAVPSDLVSMIKLVARQAIEAVLDSKEVSSRQAATSEGDQKPEQVHSATRKAENPSVSVTRQVGTQKIEAPLDSKEVSSWRSVTSDGGQNPKQVHCAKRKAENPSEVRPNLQQRASTSGFLSQPKTASCMDLPPAILDSKEVSSRQAITSEGGQNPKQVHCANRKAENPSEAQSERPLKYASASFKEEVRVCPTLLECRERAEEINPLWEKPGDSKLYWDNALLYRELYRGMNSALPQGRQMVVPRAFREEIMKIAHEVPLSGHLEFERTLAKITSAFYWPGIPSDVMKYVSSCQVCQKVGYASDRGKESLRNFHPIRRPFSEIQIDIQGPFTPTRFGENFILVVIDLATCFPITIPLRSITSASVAKALLDFFVAYGFPRVMFSDRGTSFMSKLMQRLHELAGVTQRLSTACHPLPCRQITNWGVTFTHMLKVFCEEHYRNWDEALPLLLSAYRDTIHPALQSRSPNELLFGKNLPGVLEFLRTNWEGACAPDTPQYLASIQQAVQSVRKMAQAALAEARGKQKAPYDKTAKRTLEKRDLVLLLSPEAVGKLDLRWTGPFIVEENCGFGNYRIRVPAKGTVSVHVNRLKKFIHREAQQMSIETWPEEDFDLPDLISDVEQPDGLAQLPVNENLTPPQYLQLMGVLRSYARVFTNRPGRTNQTVCDIDTGDAKPIKCNPGPIQSLLIVKAQIDKMLQLGIIERCTSEWRSNVVIVTKKRLDEADPPQYHLCVDFRKLNKLCKANQYPSPNIEEVLERLARANFITTFDLRRGHWQVPLSERAKERTSFTCCLGQFCFNVLPFGISSASQEFQRLIDQVLQGLDCAVAYQDDVAVISSSWQEHLQHLRVVLQKIERAGLTIKPSTCQIADSSVIYLGRRIGGGKISPHIAKIDAVVNWPTPETRKQVLSFLRACELYKRFIPNYGKLVSPLRHMKNEPFTIQWSYKCQTTFETLKKILAQAPILKPPDYTQPFIVRTDANPFGLGVVLMQKDQNGFLHPVLYLSRKLLPRENEYRPDEQGALAVVWGLNQLKTHLRGTHFQLETDNKPLAFIQSMEKTNSRILRWALSLQDLSFDVTLIGSKANALADALSLCFNDSE